MIAAFVMAWFAVASFSDPSFLHFLGFFFCHFTSYLNREEFFSSATGFNTSVVNLYNEISLIVVVLEKNES